MPGANAWLHAPLPNSSIGECEKYRHLRYERTSVDKTDEDATLFIQLEHMNNLVAHLHFLISLS